MICTNIRACAVYVFASLVSVPLNTDSSSTITQTPIGPVVASISSVMLASAGISNVAVTLGEITFAVATAVKVWLNATVGTIATVVGATPVCSSVGIPVGVLPAGMVGEAVMLGRAVGWLASGLINCCTWENPCETSINNATAIVIIATISGMRVLPMRCANVGGSCGRFSGIVGGGTGTSCVSS